MEDTSKKINIPLGKLLIEKKVITDDQLLQALEVQRKTGDKLGHTLVKLKYLTEDDLIKVLEKQFGIPAVKINLKMLHPFVMKTIPEKVCRKFRIIPILLDDNNKLTIASANPYDLSFINEVKFTTNYDIQVILSPESSILEAINFCFGKKDYDWIDDTEENTESRYDSTSLKMLDMIFIQGYNMGAREIQLEFSDQQINVVFITPATVITNKSLPTQYTHGLLLRIKSLANLDDTEEGFKEGIFKKDIYGVKYLIRILVFPTPAGENIVFKFS